MTAVNTTPGEKILVKISADGGATYNHPVLINQNRGITFTLNTNSDEVPDQTNPSLPATTVRTPKSTDSKIDGTGIMDSNSVIVWTQMAANAGTAIPVKYTVTFANATANSLTVTGTYYLTSFQHTGTARQKATVSLTLEQADAYAVALA